MWLLKHKCKQRLLCPQVQKYNNENLFSPSTLHTKKQMKKKKKVCLSRMFPCVAVPVQPLRSAFISRLNGPLDPG